MAITVQEAQVIFSSDGLAQVQTKAGLAGRALDGATSSAGRLVSKLQGIGGSMRNFATGIGGLLTTLGAGAGASAMINLAGTAEQTAIAFEVMLGSAGGAKAMIDSMRALDLKSAFSFQDLSEAGKLMLNFGVAADTVVPMLSVLGDIAAGDSEKLHRLSLSFSQMTAAGRLMGQDLLQMVNAGFNPLQEISKKTGESMKQLKDRMEAGGISAAEVSDAFHSATQAGGRFHGMNDRMSETTLGQWNKLKGSIGLLAIELGTVLLPEANKLIDWAQGLVTSTSGAASSLQRFVTNIKTRMAETKEYLANELGLVFFQTMAADASSWFQSIADNVADIGVVFGTITGEILIRWTNMFDSIQTYAQAVFDWMGKNAAVVAENMTARLANAQARLTGKTEETVWRIDQDGNRVQVTKSLLRPTNQEFVPFVAPGSSKPETRGFWEAITEELETARRIRQEGRNEKDKPGEGDKSGDGKGGEGDGSGGGGGGIDGETKRAATFSAESLFASLRESALGKQLDIQQKQLDVQEQQLEQQKQMAEHAKNLKLGLK